LRRRSTTAPETRTIITDSSGQFVFFDVAEGSYDLEASKVGYWFGTYGQKLPDDRGRFLTVSAAEQLTSISVAVWKLAIVSGTLLNEHGEPAVGWPVHVMSARVRAGRGEWVPQSSRVVTDDRGAFTIGDLYRGRYLVYVPGTPTPFEIGTELLTYPLTIHPAATSIASASPLDLDFGDERSGVNIHVRPVAARRLAGRVAVFPAARTLVRLSILDEVTGSDIEIATTRSAPDGTFIFPGVAPGSYRVSMAAPGSSAMNFALASDPDPSFTQRQGQMSISVPVTVAEADVLDVQLAPSASLEIAVRLRFKNEPGATVPAAGTISVSVSSTKGGYGGIARPDAEDVYRFAVPAGSYFVRPIAIPTGWRLHSITADGLDALDSPIVLVDAGAADVVITLTDAMTTVTGSVLNTDGRAFAGAAQNASIAIFPVLPRLWVDFGVAHPRFATARVNPDGTFAASGLPEGDYYVVALPDDQMLMWTEHTMLTRLARLATRVRVSAGSTSPPALSLRVVTGR
jgi:hypothetical protein